MIACELMAFKVIPVIRRAAAVKMAGKMKQKQIAEELGITESAVSQYLSKKRGNHGSFIEKIVEKSVDKFAGEEMAHSERVCAICRDLRATRSLCLIHAKKNPSFDTRGCDACKAAC